MTLGVLLNPDTATSVLDKGSPADSTEVSVLVTARDYRQVFNYGFILRGEVRVLLLSF